MKFRLVISCSLKSGEILPVIKGLASKARTHQKFDLCLNEHYSKIEVKLKQFCSELPEQRVSKHRGLRLLRPAEFDTGQRDKQENAS